MALLVTESQAERVQADPAGPTRQSGPCNWLIVLLPLPELCKTFFLLLLNRGLGKLPLLLAALTFQANLMVAWLH